MSKKLVGHLATILGNVILGLGVPVTSSLLEKWITPEAYTLLRMIFGALIFWIIGSLVKKERVARRDMFVIATGGFFGFIATQLFFANALQYTTPVYFSLVMSLTPILVLIMSLIFLKEKLNGSKIFGVLLSIAGASLVILAGKSGGLAQNNTLGIVLSFLAALSYAIYIIATRNVSTKYGPVAVTKWSFLFAALMLLPFEIVNLPVQKIFTTAVTAGALSQLGYLLIFSTAIGFLLMPIGLKRIKATTVSIYMNLQPIVASLVAIIAGQDVFSWDKPVAAVFVISGVYFVTREVKENKQAKTHKQRRFRLKS